MAIVPTPPPAPQPTTLAPLLLHFGLTHNFGHWHDITTVLGFLGIPT